MFMQLSLSGYTFSRLPTFCESYRWLQKKTWFKIGLVHKSCLSMDMTRTEKVRLDEYVICSRQPVSEGT